MTKARDLSLAAKAPIASPSFTGTVAIGHTTTSGSTFAICDGANSQIQFFPEISTDTNLTQHYDPTASAYINAETRAATHAFKTGTTERMRIDATGRVTKPYQPIISGQMNSAQTNPAGPILLSFNEFWTNSGITFNATTKRFTVPTSGTYRITLNPFFKTGVGNGRVLVGVNTDSPAADDHRGHAYRQSTNYETGCINSVVYLSANDYIVFKLQQGALYNTTSDRFNQFSIELIG